MPDVSFGPFRRFLTMSPTARHPPDPSLAWTRPTKAHKGQQEPTKRKKGPGAGLLTTTNHPSSPPTPPHHPQHRQHHHHQGLRHVSGPFFVILFTTITITGARASVSFYLFYFILYFTEAETCLGPLFVLFYFYFILSTSQGPRCVLVPCFFCYCSFYFTRAWVRSSNLN